MAIVYEPKKYLKLATPKIEKMLKGNISLKKVALSTVDELDFLNDKQVNQVALKAIKSYKKRIKDAEQGTKTEVRSEIKEDPKLLINRVHNEVVTQITEGIKSNYGGELYEWLPSDAVEPDPEHQANYGKVFTVGDGEMPGDRYGCRCGMNILVKGSKLELG